LGKALFYVAAARNFSLFWDWVDRVDFVDKLIIRNYLLHEAHAYAMKYFFEHSEYDYFVMSSDDVLGTPDHLKQLIRDEEEHGFPVVSAWCNVLTDKPWAAVSVAPIDPKVIASKLVTYESYNFVHIHDILLARYGYPFFSAWFIGLPLTLIRRDVLKRVPLRAFRNRSRDPFSKYALDPRVRAEGRGIMFDLQFAVDCAAQKIPITVDSRLFLLHFGFMGSYIKIGVDPRRIDFVKANLEK